MGALALVLALGGCANGAIRLYDGPARPSDQVAVLVLPEAIELASVNGNDTRATQGAFRKGDAVLELEPGRYRLRVFYRELWRLGDDDDNLRSNPVLFDLQAAAGARYRVDYPRPARYEEALALSREFSAWIEGLDDGARIPSQALAAGRGVRPLPDGPSGRLQSMKDWWTQATPEERSEFLRWSAEQGL